MNLPFFTLAAFSLLNFIATAPTDSRSNVSPALFARVLPEVQPHAEHEAPMRKEPEMRPGLAPIPETGTRTTSQSIRNTIQNLPKQRWVKDLPTKADALKRVVGIRPRYRGKPEQLVEVDQDGLPTDRLRPITKEEIGRLKEVQNTEGRMFSVTSKFEDVLVHPWTGQVVRVPYYETKYVSPAWAIRALYDSNTLYSPYLNDGIERQKRSIDIEALMNGPAGTSVAATSQDSTAVFQQYLQTLHTVQSSVAALIAPVLNNLTSQSNSTLVHQMAQSIYYDLTGSTTVLVGPFNYGMSFLGNITGTTGQGENNATSNATAEFEATIKNIYTSMWGQALTAANATGIYGQQVYLAGCLSTNDSSVYPATFTTASQGINTTSASI